MSARNADVNLIVRAKTEGERAIAALTDTLEELLGGAGELKGGISDLGATIGLLDRTFALMNDKADQAAAAFARQQKNIAESRAQLASLEAQLESSTRAADALRTAIVDDKLDGRDPSENIRRLKAVEQAQSSLSTSAQKLRTSVVSQESALDGTRSSMQRLGSTTNALEAAQREATNRIKQNAAALDEEAAAADRAGAAVDRKNRKDNAQTPGLFGLKPYELTNLGYQVNDVLTQLASGTNPIQVLAQQGGQILQLFPRVGSAIVAALSNPAILTAVGAFVALGAGIKKAADEAERLRQFSGELSFRTDGDAYDPAKVAATAAVLERMGVASKDADAAVRSLIDEGVDASRLDELARAGKQVADVFGGDLASSVKEAGEAFTGGYDAIAKLDERLNFLTAAEREHIRELFNEGNAQAARTEALNAYVRQADEAAEKQRGPWGEASKALTRAWDSLLKTIGNSLPVRAAIFVLNELAGVVRDLGNSVADALGNAPGATTDGAARIGEVQTQIKTLQEQIANYEAMIAKKSPISGTLGRLVAISKEQLSEAQKELAKLEQHASDVLTGDSDSKRAKERSDRLADIDLQQRLEELRRRGQEGLNSADSKRRADLAGELAFRKEMASTGDRIVAARLKERAVAEETLQIEQANERARKAAAAAREREIQQFSRRVVGAEGGTAQNPYSSAKGYGQFIASTFIDVYKRVPGADQSLGNEQILALRNNEKIARAVIDQYARENAKFLESFGAKVTAGNLYLAHFLGPNTAKAVLQAPGDKPVDEIIRRVDRNSASVLSGNKGYLRTENGKGRYRTAAELQTFIAGRVGDTGEAQAGLVEEQSRIERANLERQQNLNTAIRQGNDERQRTVESLTAQNGLYGTALLAEQRRQAMLNAELELRQKIEDANKNLKPGESPAEVTQAEIDKTKELAGALFDAQHAREALNAKLADAGRPLEDYQQQVDLLRQQAEFARSIGDISSAEKIERQIAGVNEKLSESIELLIQFYEALSPSQRVELGILSDEQFDNLKSKLRGLKTESQEWGRIGVLSARDVAQAMGQSAANAFTRFIDKVAAGKNVFKSLGQGVLEFAANFAGAIAQMIIQLLAYAAAVSVLRALGVPVPSFPVHHTGGIAGQAGSRRPLNPMWFYGANRYHNGGIAGLAPDEVPSILQRGEEVLTTSDPRHRFNGGGSGGGQAPVTVNNFLDAEEFVSVGIATDGGGRAIMNFMRANRETLSVMFGGSS